MAASLYPRLDDDDRDYDPLEDYDLGVGDSEAMEMPSLEDLDDTIQTLDGTDGLIKDLVTDDSEPEEAPSMDGESFDMDEDKLTYMDGSNNTDAAVAALTHSITGQANSDERDGNPTALDYSADKPPDDMDMEDEQMDRFNSEREVEFRLEAEERIRVDDTIDDSGVDKQQQDMLMDEMKQASIAREYPMLGTRRGGLREGSGVA